MKESTFYFNLGNNNDYQQLFKKQIDFLSCVSNEVKESLSEYSNKKYDIINKDVAIKVDNDDCKNILDIFKHIPSIENDVIVYRGISNITKMEAVKHFPNSFISTSLNQNVAKSFASNDDNVIEIKIPKYSKILPLAILSKFPDELEILLPPKGTYKYNGKVLEYTQDSKYNKKHDKFLNCDIYTSMLTIYISNDIYTKVKNIIPKTGIDIQGKITQYNFNIKGQIFDENNIPFLKELKTLTQEYKDSQVIYKFQTNKNNFIISIIDGKLNKKVS